MDLPLTPALSGLLFIYSYLLTARCGRARFCRQRVPFGLGCHTRELIARHFKKHPGGAQCVVGCVSWIWGLPRSEIEQG